MKKIFGSKKPFLDSLAFETLEVNSFELKLKLDIKTVKVDPSAPFGLKGLSKECLDYLNKCDIDQKLVDKDPTKLLLALDYKINRSQRAVKRLDVEKLKKYKPDYIYSDPSDKYEKKEQLGKGGGGDVWRYTDVDTDEDVAIKISVADTKHIKMIESEVAFMMMADHENLLKYIDAYQFDGCIYLVLELMANSIRSLCHTSITWQEEQIAYVLNECFKALQYLHINNIVHRDLKSHNILYDLKGNIKVADFGLVSPLEKKENIPVAGTPQWMAPEVISKETYNAKADIWSMGIVCLEMSEGNPPYRGGNDIETIFQIIVDEQAPFFAEPDKWSPEYQHLLSVMLVKSVSQRADINQAMESEFIDMRMKKEEFAKSIPSLVRKK